MTKDKYHWFQFFPAVWLQDPELCRCSLAARGVWMDLLCFMVASEERGVLVTAGVAWTAEDAACAVRGNQDVCLSGIEELTRCGVLRCRESDGAMYCARMVRERDLGGTRADAGRLGGLAKAKQKPSKQGSKHPSNSLGVTLTSNSNSSSLRKEKKREKERALTLYELYPRHVGKIGALVAIGKALREVDYEVLKVAIERYAKSRVGEDSEFTPYMAKWLKRGSWEDEPDKPTSWTREDEKDDD